MTLPLVFGVFIGDFQAADLNDVCHIFVTRVTYLPGISIKDFMQLD